MRQATRAELHLNPPPFFDMAEDTGGVQYLVLAASVILSAAKNLFPPSFAKSTDSDSSRILRQFSISNNSLGAEMPSISLSVAGPCGVMSNLFRISQYNCFR